MNADHPAHPSGRPGAARDTKSVLYEAAVEAVQDRASQAKAKASRPARASRRGVRNAFLLLLATAGAVLLVLRPNWLVGPDSVPAETPAIAAASLRIVLVRERDMVFRYQRRTGTLPVRLADAGVHATDLEYRHEGPAFTLSGQAGDSLITIRSTDSVTTFLGDSFSRLRHRNTP
jgi:hypothetical protein